MATVVTMPPKMVAGPTSVGRSEGRKEIGGDGAGRRSSVKEWRIRLTDEVGDGDGGDYAAEDGGRTGEESSPSVFAVVLRLSSEVVNVICSFRM
ncbi:hypothetical protein PIB30_009219 [Stylosanthes scabra]|uniref:Uncharacterized protein n=1 Tax=Stylosanthes scabra TaxID=79078 RepID=A0ABU6Q673_9FABA|nr:hypothetical protein [Stylosanthes scabra]